MDLLEPGLPGPRLRVGRRVPAAAVHRVRHHPRRPRRGDLRRRLGIGRDVGPARDRCSPRRCRAGALGARGGAADAVDIAIVRRSSARLGIGLGGATVGGDLLHARRRHALARPVRGGAGRHRVAVGGRVRRPLRGTGRGVFVLVTWLVQTCSGRSCGCPDPSSNSRSPRTSASRWSASGTGRHRRVARPGDRRHRPRRRGASSAATWAAEKLVRAGGRSPPLRRPPAQTRPPPMSWPTA